jgi:secretion/DNA translocation related TadE-like protein
LTAAVMVLACVLSLVAADVSVALATRARAQTAADAAALAAAQEIAIPSGRTPEEAAAEYAQRNGGELIACRCDPGTGEAVVTVELPVHLLFLGPDRAVQAQARAVVGSATRTGERWRIPDPSTLAGGGRTTIANARGRGPPGRMAADVRSETSRSTDRSGA